MYSYNHCLFSNARSSRNTGLKNISKPIIIRRLTTVILLLQPHKAEYACDKCKAAVEGIKRLKDYRIYPVKNCKFQTYGIFVISHGIANMPTTMN